MFKTIRNRLGPTHNNPNGGGGGGGGGGGTDGDDVVGAEFPHDEVRIIRAPNDHRGFDEEDGFVVAANSYVTSSNQSALSTSSDGGGTNRSFSSAGDVPDHLPLLSNSTSDSQDENYPPTAPNVVREKKNQRGKIDTKAGRTKGGNSLNKFGSSAREGRNKKKFTALTEKENNNIVARSPNPKQVRSSDSAVPYQSFNSPFRTYLNQIENDYGVTSVESVGPQPSRDMGGDEGNYATDDVSLVTDAYAFSVQNIDSAAYEDDVSTLGDESIRRARRTVQRPVEADTVSAGLSFLSPMTESKVEVEKKSISPQKKKKKKTMRQTSKSRTNQMSIEPTRTRSTLIASSFTIDDEMISPKSDLDSSIFHDGNIINDNKNSSTITGGDDIDESTINADHDVKNKVPKHIDHVKDTKDDGYDEEDTTTFMKRNKWAIIYFMVVLAIFLLVIAGVALTFSFMYLKQEQQQQQEYMSGSNSESATNNNNNAVDDPPTDAPSVGTAKPSSPKPAPTASPMRPSKPPGGSPPSRPPSSNVTTNVTREDDLFEIEQDLLSILAEYFPPSVTAVGDFESPQYQALDWLINDPRYWDYEVPIVVQRYALAVLYHSTGGSEWTTENIPTSPETKTPWLSYSDECSWEMTNVGISGKTCNTEFKVIRIHLVNIGLKGSIPAEIALLSNGLKGLFVDKNDLKGSIPPELGELTLMEKLELSNNKLQGTIPSELARMADLSVLGLGSNRLEGPIPSELGQLTKMRVIGLESNFLQGSIPVQFCDMIEMETLAMEHNRLSGTVPSECSAMVKLRKFSAQKNDLTGTMPAGLCPGPGLAMTDLMADCEEILCDCCTGCHQDPPSETIETPPPFDGDGV